MLSCLACAWYLIAASRKPRVDAQPLMLERVQALGDLHTARYNFSRIFQHQTQLEPEGVASMIPLATNIVHAATRNKALVTVVGSVEAGVDMRRAKITRQAQGWAVELPSPTVYETQARASVEDQKVGFFWLDPNIGLDAERIAANEFRVGAIEHGIKDMAQAEAAKRVRELLYGVTNERIQVQFAS